MVGCACSLAADLREERGDSDKGPDAERSEGTERGEVLGEAVPLGEGFLCDGPASFEGKSDPFVLTVASSDAETLSPEGSACSTVSTAYRLSLDSAGRAGLLLEE